MISVVIPTLNAGRRLPACLKALRADDPAGDASLEIVISDGGSDDRTLEIAHAVGARIVAGPPGRGGQLARGAAAARGDWLLFLHADTVLGAGWAQEARAFMGEYPDAAAVFSLKFDQTGLAPRLVAGGAMLRTKIFASPYGDQGLLLSRRLYDDIGGFDDQPLFEDVEMIDRLIKAKGRKALKILQTTATTSAERYERDGYIARVAKNFACLMMYRFGVPPARINAYYRK